MKEIQGKIKRVTEGSRYYELDNKRYPSTTQILSFYPKTKQFYNWLMAVGKKADEIRDTAAEKGSKIHEAIENHLRGKNFNYDKTTIKYLDQFKKWFNSNKIKVIDIEKFIVNKEIGYAGTVDLIIELNGVLYIIDIKTGKGIYPTHHLQLSAYKHAVFPRTKCKLGILHLTEDSYEFIETKDLFDLFLSVFEIYKHEQNQKI